MKVCWKCGAQVADEHRFCMKCGSDQSRAAGAADPLIGRTLINKYRIEAPIGSGAMGTIYRAEQVALGKVIVIKVLHRHLMGDNELLQRFEREARAASRLNHPNCVQIIDFGSLPDGALYIAMEFIDGIDLADLIEREYPIPHLRVVRIVKQICVALDEAHANGVLHRDLKPENIMLENRRNAPDHVKVVDFGIAKLDDAHPGSRRAFQTRAGIVCGTPEYMSPEQARGEKLDARSDIYALGVLLYHVVTDRLPFEGGSPIETVTRHITETPVRPVAYRQDLPESLDTLIMTLLAKDREQRPPSAMDVFAELERIERELLLNEAQNPGVGASDKTAVDIRPISALIDLIDLATPDKPGLPNGLPNSLKGPSTNVLPAHVPAPRTLAAMAPAPTAAAAPAPTRGGSVAKAPARTDDPQGSPTDELDRDAVTRLGGRPQRPQRGGANAAPKTNGRKDEQELDTVLESVAIDSSAARGPNSALLKRSQLRDANGPASGLMNIPVRSDNTPKADAEIGRESITHQALEPVESSTRRSLWWIGLGLLLAAGAITVVILAT